MIPPRISCVNIAWGGDPLKEFVRDICCRTKTNKYFDKRVPVIGGDSSYVVRAREVEQHGVVELSVRDVATRETGGKLVVGFKAVSL